MSMLGYATEHPKFLPLQWSKLGACPDRVMAYHQPAGPGFPRVQKVGLWRGGGGEVWGQNVVEQIWS